MATPPRKKKKKKKKKKEIYRAQVIKVSVRSTAISYTTTIRSIKYIESIFKNLQLNGCGMGPLLVLVSPCSRKNAVVTCKTGSFLCSLDTLLQKNVIVFFFGNQISKWRSFENGAIFGLLFTFFSHLGKVAKIPSPRISLT